MPVGQMRCIKNLEFVAQGNHYGFEHGNDTVELFG